MGASAALLQLADQGASALEVRRSCRNVSCFLRNSTAKDGAPPGAKKASLLCIGSDQESENGNPHVNKVPKNILLPNHFGFLLWPKDSST